MTVTFNPGALDMFRNAQLANENSIANLDGQGGLKANGKLGSFLWKPFRSTETQANNNAVRTELLKSLGRAFNLSGMSEANGKVTFSKDFMAKLEKLLGRDILKTGDFEIAADGTVSSGKPLTQRRISAIINRATVVSRGEYNVATYRVKLDRVKGEIARFAPGKTTTDAVKSYFEHVGKCIEFLDKDLEGLFEENWEWSEKRAKADKNYNVPRYIFKQPGKFEGIETKTRGPFVNYLLDDSPIHGLFHFELYRNLPRELNTPEDLKANMDYVRSTLTLYIQSSIDLFLDAMDAGKLPELAEKIAAHPGACMDDKASMPGDFRKELGLFTEEEAGLNNVAEHDARTKLDKCIYEEIRVANANIKAATGKDAKGWQELAGAVKKALVGQTRPIMTLNAKSGAVEPLMENGKQVIRKVTAEDVDRIGPACANILGIF